MEEWLLCLRLCLEGRLKEVKKYYLDIQIIDHNEYFGNFCNYGLLKIAKWLFKIKPEIDISAYDEYAFSYAVENGHLKVAKWLLEIKPNINISTNNEYAFRNAVANGHLYMAKWLLQIKSSINISAKNNWAFQWACECGYLKTVRWLLKIKPATNIFAKKTFLIEFSLSRFRKKDLKVTKYLSKIQTKKIYLYLPHELILNNIITKEYTKKQQIIKFL